MKRLFIASILFVSSALFFGIAASAQAATVDLKANGSDIPYIAYNTSATLQWTTSGVNSCTASNSWSGTKAVPNGSEPTGPLNGSRSYTLKCLMTTTGVKAEDTVTVNVLPPNNDPASVVIRADGKTVSTSIAYNTSATISWTSNNAVSCFSNDSAWYGTKATSGSESTGNLLRSRIYTIKCKNPAGTESPQSLVTVYVGDPPPTPPPTLRTVDLKVNGSDGPVVVVAHTLMTVSWATTGAISHCIASNNATNGVAQIWVNQKPIPSGSMEIGASWPSPFKLTLTCYDYSNSPVASDSVQVNYYSPPPTPTPPPSPFAVDLKVNGSDGPITIANGTSALLSWTSTDALWCVASQDWSGNKPISGSEQTGNITSVKLYKITCVNKYTGAQVADSVTVNVSAPAGPTVDLKANGSNGPITIAFGTSATLSWTSTQSNSCRASNGWTGIKATSNTGESTGNLTSSKTYQLTCGNVFDSVTVNVGTTTPDGTVDLKVNGVNGPITIPSGTSATLTWTSTNARPTNSCWATGGWNGPFLPEGGLWKAANNTSPGESTGNLTASRTYFLQCYPPGPGLPPPNLDSVTVNVSGGTGNQPPVAAARISANNSPFGERATVTRGVPAFIKLSSGLSFDPDNWTTPGTGVSQGGKCEWNTDLNQGTITYERTISNPASPSSCDTDLGYLTFNDPPDWYLYPVLRITDASAGVSNVASVTVIVNDPNNPTPTPNPSGSPSPTPSCNPFGYNSNCPTPTPTLTPTPTILPTVLPDPDQCASGATCTDDIIDIIIDKIKIINDIVYDIIDIIIDKTKIINDIVDDVVRTIQNVLNRLVGTVAKGIAALLGVDPAKVAKFIEDAGSFLTNLALALGIPLIIANLLPQLAHWGRFLGSFFGAHHRKDRWGMVVDSDVGKPIAGAVVQVFDAAFNKLKETQITGKDGQFGFLLVPGKYYVVTSASGFTFPARKKAPVVLREHERIYLGEEFTISDQNQETIPHIVVPLDRQEQVSASKAIFARFITTLLGFVDRVGFTFLFIGAGINTYLLLLSPNTLNVVFEVLYLLLFMLKFYILVFNQKGIGMVTDGATKVKLDLAIVRLYDSATNRIVQTRVTNKNGRFFLLVPRGTYTVAVSKPGYETLTMGDVQIKKSGSKAISLDFSLKKQA